MSAFFDAVAVAALPVAVGLLLLAAAARVVLWAPVGDVPVRRAARQHLGPLCTWSLAAFVVYAIALTAAGSASVLSLAVALVLAATAVVLSPGAEAPRPDAAAAPRTATPAAPRGDTTTTPWAETPRRARARRRQSRAAGRDARGLARRVALAGAGGRLAVGGRARRGVRAPAGAVEPMTPARA